MHEQTGRHDDEIVAFTLHDGPGRPAEGPPPSRSLVMAAAWMGWTVLAFVGCQVFHEGGTAHLDLPAWQDVLAVGTLLAIPATIGFLAAGRALGAWLSMVVGVMATWLSLTQIATVPVYTAIEAGGFALLAVAGAWLLRQHRAGRRSAPAAAAHASDEASAMSPLDLSR